MIGELDLLRKLYEVVYIPQAVFDEIVIKGEGQIGAEDIKNSEWIKVLPVQNRLLVKSLFLQLDIGESEAIVLAIEHSANLVLLDEKRGRNIASEFNLRPFGLLGVLVQAKKLGLILEIKPLIDKLRYVAGFWIDNKLYQAVLNSVNE